MIRMPGVILPDALRIAVVPPISSSLRGSSGCQAANAALACGAMLMCTILLALSDLPPQAATRKAGWAAVERVLGKRSAVYMADTQAHRGPGPRTGPLCTPASTMGVWQADQD